jgi:hypothetical protein
MDHSDFKNYDAPFEASIPFFLMALSGFVQRSGHTGPDKISV